MTNKSKNERLEVLKRRRALYLEAEEAILNSQEYKNGTFTQRRAELEFVQKEINALDKEILLVESGGKRFAFRVTPRDL